MTELERRRVWVNCEDKVLSSGHTLWPYPCVTVREICSAGYPPPPSTQPLLTISVPRDFSLMVLFI